MSSPQQEHEARAIERLTFFSDAVAAIAMTLLAIDLPVPSGATAAQFWTSVQDASGHYAAFLFSFAVIASAWSGHHDLYRYAEHMDGRLRLLNFGWLLTIVLIPFAAKLLTTRGPETTVVHALRFSTYALLQVLESAALLAARRHLITRGQAPGLPPQLARMGWETAALLTGFGLSIPLFFAVPWAWVLWLVVPLAAAARSSRLRHRPPRQPGPA